jgi:hypothetical protein
VALHPTPEAWLALAPCAPRGRRPPPPRARLPRAFRAPGRAGALPCSPRSGEGEAPARAPPPTSASCSTPSRPRFDAELAGRARLPHPCLLARCWRAPRPGACWTWAAAPGLSGVALRPSPPGWRGWTCRRACSSRRGRAALRRAARGGPARTSCPAAAAPGTHRRRRRA